MSERLFAVLLRILPAAFRRRYGPGLRDAFREQAAEPRYRGVPGRAALWATVAADLARTAVRLRVRRVRPLQGDDHDPRGEVGMMGRVWQDFRAALRSLRRSPAFTAVVVATLALGIGADAALVGVVRGVLLAPLPYDEADRLATVWSRWVNFDQTWVSSGEFRHYTQESRSFRSLAAWGSTDVSLTDPDRPERVRAAVATHDLLEVLGVQVALGRDLDAEDARSDAGVALIGSRLWERRFDGDPSVIGRTLEVNGTRVEVVGVLPAGFAMPTDYGDVGETEMVFPLWIDVEDRSPVPSYGGNHGLYVVGRLAADATAASAQEEMDRLVAALEADGVYPPEWSFRALVVPLRDQVLGRTRDALWVLLGGVTLVLLIACANVANLMLARSRERGRELAVRAALGARRARIVRQLLLESGLLAVAGGLLGWLGATAAVPAILAMAPGSVPRSGNVAMDGSILAYTFAVSLATAVAFGLVPALRASRDDLAGVLREGGRGEAGSRAENRAQGGLVATQAALAVVLLVAAGLMGRTFQGLAAIDPGFDAGESLTLRLSLPAASYPDPEASSAFYDELLRQVRGLPGVEAAGVVRNLPLANEIGDAGVQVEGYTPGQGESPSGDWQIVSEGYFEALRIPLVDGRAFLPSDRADEDVVVINETMAARYWEGRNPLGSRMSAMGDTLTVVGIAGDVVHNGITAAAKPKFYRLNRQVAPSWAGATRSMTLVARTRGDPYALLAPTRAVVRELDPRLAVSEVQTMDEVLARTVGQPRMVASLLAVFAAVALLLAVVGVYGVLSYAVERRTREIGVRMALGADRATVMSATLLGGVRLVVVGLVVGMAASWLGSRLLETLLYGVEPTDPGVFALAAIALTVAAVAAGGIPAWRATRVDVVRALHAD